MFVDLQSRWHQKKPNIRFLDVQLDEFILQISTSNTVRDIKMQRGYYTKSHEIERERERWGGERESLSGKKCIQLDSLMFLKK